MPTATTEVSRGTVTVDQVEIEGRQAWVKRDAVGIVGIYYDLAALESDSHGPN